MLCYAATTEIATRANQSLKWRGNTPHSGGHLTSCGLRIALTAAVGWLFGVCRVLKPGGAIIYITYGAPPSRAHLFSVCYNLKPTPSLLCILTARSACSIVQPKLSITLQPTITIRTSVFLHLMVSHRTDIQTVACVDVQPNRTVRSAPAVDVTSGSIIRGFNRSRDRIGQSVR